MPSPGGTTIARRAHAGGGKLRLGRLRDGARATFSSVTIASGGAGLERRDARAQLGEQPAADHDVIGAVAERDIHGGGFAGAQRSGHHARGLRDVAGAATPSRRGKRRDDLVDDRLVRDVARHHGDVGLA